MQFQSTRPRGARLFVQLCVSCSKHISIHAPARGATFEIAVVCLRVFISIHAPARGATAGRAVLPTISSFQSTRSRGARLWDPKAGDWSSLFQSTRPRGARLYLRLSKEDGDKISIHAPARGATVVFCATTRLDTCISIHAPARGATSKQNAGRLVMTISIHAPARGATSYIVCQ